MAPQVHRLRIFADGLHGGNPLPVVIDAAGMEDGDMQAVAASSGHESGFVFPAPPNSDLDFEFRFWVPEHEMEMCGHATVGAVWLLKKLGKLPGDHVRVLTRSGVVEARVGRREEGTWVEISQGQGVVEVVPQDNEVHSTLLSTLGVKKSDLAPGYPIHNSRTSRVKTMIPLLNVDVLDGLKPQFSQVEHLCELLGSTGLYPYAIVADEGNQIFSARQFPKKSGYNEDAATGIAAAALAFALLENGLVSIDGEITVKQGRAMGAPSSIAVHFKKGGGCWIGGTAMLDEEHD